MSLRTFCDNNKIIISTFITIIYMTIFWNVTQIKLYYDKNNYHY